MRKVALGHNGLIIQTKVLFRWIVQVRYGIPYIVIFCQSLTQDPFIKCMTGGVCIVIIQLNSSHFKQILVLCSEKIHCQAK